MVRVSKSDSVFDTALNISCFKQMLASNYFDLFSIIPKTEKRKQPPKPLLFEPKASRSTKKESVSCGPHNNIYQACWDPWLFVLIFDFMSIFDFTQLTGRGLESVSAETSKRPTERNVSFCTP